MGPPLLIMPLLFTPPLLSMPPLLTMQLPQPTMLQPLLTSLPLMLRRRELPSPTLTSTLLLTITPRLLSMLEKLLMLMVLFLDLTLLLFPMAAPRTSSTPLTTTMDMLLMSPMRVSQYILRPSLMFLHLHLLIMLKYL